MGIYLMETWMLVVILISLAVAIAVLYLVIKRAVFKAGYELWMLQEQRKKEELRALELKNKKN